MSALNLCMCARVYTVCVCVCACVYSVCVCACVYSVCVCACVYSVCVCVHACAYVINMVWAVASEYGQLHQTILHKLQGKIQGDNQKFLDRFKSYLGSQISSLNEVHIYRLQPKPAIKGVFFSHIFVFDCFKSASPIANGERSRQSAATVLGMWPH